MQDGNELKQKYDKSKLEGTQTETALRLSSREKKKLTIKQEQLYLKKDKWERSG